MEPKGTLEMFLLSHGLRYKWLISEGFCRSSRMVRPDNAKAGRDATKERKEQGECKSKDSKQLLHYNSTNEQPRHHLCPVGPDSWCKWQVGDDHGRGGRGVRRMGREQNYMTQKISFWVNLRVMVWPDVRGKD